MTRLHLAALLVLLHQPPLESATVQGSRAPCPTAASWSTLLVEHLHRYPLMELPDAYKLLFHATMGAEHMAPTLANATARLQQELMAMGAGPEEPLHDQLGRGGRFTRIHLRPFQAAGGDQAELARSFVAAAAASPDPVGLRCALDALIAAAGAGEVPWSQGEVSAYVAARAAEGFPAVHHSPAFAAAYRPAYRVVLTRVPPP